MFVKLKCWNVRKGKHVDFFSAREVESILKLSLVELVDELGFVDFIVDLRTRTELMSVEIARFTFRIEDR